METNSASGSIYSRVSCWILVLPLLVLAAQGGFSFQQGSINTFVGYAASGIVSPMSSNETAMLQVQRGLVYLVCLFVMVPLVHTITAEYRHHKLIVALLLLAFLSVLWSQNAWKTFLSTVLLAVDLGFAVYLVKRFTWNNLLKILILIGAIAGTSTLLLVFAFPEYGLQGEKLQGFGAWQGIFDHKNMCGSVTTMLLLPIFFVEFKSRYGRAFCWTYIALSLVIIVMSRSAGAYVVCALCMIFVPAVRSFAKLSHRTAIAVGMVSTGILICVGYAVYQYSDSLMDLLGKDPTMTGRTVIWGLLLPSILKHPLFGYGYMAFWQSGLRGESANVAIALNWPGIGYSENGMIDLLLGLGGIAVLIFLLLFGRAIRDAIYCFREDPSPRVMWYISILFFAAVSNVAAGQVLCPSNLGCILQIVAFVGLGQERRRLKAAPLANHFL